MILISVHTSHVIGLTQLLLFSFRHEVMESSTFNARLRAFTFALWTSGMTGGLHSDQSEDWMVSCGTTVLPAAALPCLQARLDAPLPARSPHDKVLCYLQVWPELS